MGSHGEVSILKPRNDKREYRRLVLPNDLQVLLISDPETDKGATSMDVNVGFFNNPEGLEGLAHFLEHMLFYASEKYPEEGSYKKFLIEHGGRSNAFTSSEHTNFHFDVNSGHLEAALDRFSQFFISPIMSIDATSREINAVDSEFKKNLMLDARRLKQVFRHTCLKDHPFRKFGTGNLDTLDVLPKARGVDTRAELLKFYEKHYSSNLMCLVIYGKESLEKLQNLAEEKFSNIRNTEIRPPQFPGQPCTCEHLQTLIKAVPIKEKHTLFVSWPITPELKNYKEGASRYIGHLLGHEAEGSLFALLKSLGWANSLGAGEQDTSLEFAFFAVTIELTDLGQSNVVDILGLIFQYIKILQEQGAVEWIFEEVKGVCETRFHFRDKNSPFNYVTHIAKNMQLYPPEDWLVGSSLPRNWNAGIIKDCFDVLTPQNVRVVWSSKEFEGKVTVVEPWYGTCYSIERIEDSLVEKWMKAAPDKRLRLPVPNPFIPSDFHLKNTESKLQWPTTLRNSPMSKLWYKPDTLFSTPKACIKMHCNCPGSNSSPEAYILTTIFTRLLLDSLNEYSYYAQIAGLSYDITQSEIGFQIHVYGYSQKLTILLDKIIEKIVRFEVRKDRFEVIKEKVLKDCKNLQFEQPRQQAFYYCSLLLKHRMWNIHDYVEVLPLLEGSDLSRFLHRILSRLFIDCYVSGNFTSDEALSLIMKAEKSFSDGPMHSKALFPSEHAETRVVKLDRGANFYYPQDGLNPQDKNSALELYLQVCQNETLTNVLLDLFILSAKQEAFNQLRSVEQLGYIVALLSRNDSGVRGAKFVIQSTVKNPSELDARVEAFLRKFEDKLTEMTETQFKHNVDALIEVKLEKHKNLFEESQFFWQEIVNGTLKFNRPHIEVAVLRKVEKPQLLQFFCENIKRNARNRRKISVQVFASSHKKGGGAGHLEELNGVNVNATAFSEPNTTLDFPPQVNENLGANLICIDDIFSFKRSQSLFGSIKH